jgi:aminoglycoside phosphotransferase (APT) family kinase protein
MRTGVASYSHDTRSCTAQSCNSIEGRSAVSGRLYDSTSERRRGSTRVAGSVWGERVRRHPELTAGLSSALIFRIVVCGCPYLLRVTSTDATVGPGRGDPTRQFACMRMAAEAGIAPRVWYTSTEDRVSITDFVHARSLPATEAVVRLPVILERVHALPPFPRPSAVNYLDAVDGFVRKFQAAKILPESETEELFQRYAGVANVYPRNDSDMVSSHNDLKPENILFDGDRVWLVDWEAAFLNDRYQDLAVVANFVVTNDAGRRLSSDVFRRSAG